MEWSCAAAVTVVDHGDKTMRLPKGKLLALVTLVLAAAMVTATGAFTTVQAERNINVEITGDKSAFLSIEPSDGPNGAYATQIGTGELVLNFNHKADTEGGGNPQGINPDSNTTFDNVFTVTNHGTQPVMVIVNSTADRISYYPTDGSSNTHMKKMSKGEVRNRLTISPGETVHWGVKIDATGLTKSDSIATVKDDLIIKAVATEYTKKNGK